MYGNQSRLFMKSHQFPTDGNSLFIAYLLEIFYFQVFFLINSGLFGHLIFLSLCPVRFGWLHMAVVVFKKLL